MAKRFISMLFLFFLVSGSFIGMAGAEPSTEREYDANGNCILEMYFEDGEPRRVGNGYYGIRRSYEGGRCISISYLDPQGELTNLSSGYARVERELDALGRVAQEMYYDADGKPARNAGGCYGYRRTAYDERGNCTELVYLDSSGAPMMIPAGYASLKRTYNEQNQLDTILYFNASGQPARLSLGQYGVRYGYEDGRETWLTYLGSDGQPAPTYYGYTMLRREYSETGVLCAEWYCDAEGNPMQLRRGQYGVRLVYQDGKPVERVPVNLAGETVFLLDQYLQKHPWLVYAGAAAVVLLCMTAPKRWRYGLLAAYLLFILYMTLYVREMRPDMPSSFVLFRSVQAAMESGTGYDAWAQIIHNIMLFLPLGFLLYAIHGRPLLVILGGALFSALIECTQYVTGLGYAELDDVLWNTLGTLLGLLAALAVLRRKKTTAELLESE